MKKNQGQGKKKEDGLTPQQRRERFVDEIFKILDEILIN